MEKNINVTWRVIDIKFYTDEVQNSVFLEYNIGIKIMYKFKL